ncbi:hypothetical protein KIPB_004037 [Kipferlia bialata]|uniref:Uncharacterized protein n=1 Tax=Kipferlia bialata TaxID=797122 RepID=A0A9K3GH53_9EUKA|nr:hypothetical protein KIPB_004037 [Kipferlia bialata]|eukprot:g4037.t1
MYVLTFQPVHVPTPSEEKQEVEGESKETEGESKEGEGEKKEGEGEKKEGEGESKEEEKEEEVPEPTPFDESDMSQLVLPLVGHDVLLPKGEIGEYINELLKADGFEHGFDSLPRAPKDMCVTGRYRQVIRSVSDIDVAMVVHKDKRTMFSLPEEAFVRANQALSLSLPEEVCVAMPLPEPVPEPKVEEKKEEEKPVEKHVEEKAEEPKAEPVTEETKPEKKAAEPVAEAEAEAEPKTEAVVAEGDVEMKAEAEAKPEEKVEAEAKPEEKVEEPVKVVVPPRDGHFVSLHVRFTLGSSSYATVVLRSLIGRAIERDDLIGYNFEANRFVGTEYPPSVPSGKAGLVVLPEDAEICPENQMMSYVAPRTEGDRDRGMSGHRQSGGFRMQSGDSGEAVVVVAVEEEGEGEAAGVAVEAEVASEAAGAVVASVVAEADVEASERSFGNRGDRGGDRAPAAKREQ